MSEEDKEPLELLPCYFPQEFFMRTFQYNANTLRGYLTYKIPENHSDQSPDNRELLLVTSRKAIPSEKLEQYNNIVNKVSSGDKSQFEKAKSILRDKVYANNGDEAIDEECSKLVSAIYKFGPVPAYNTELECTETSENFADLNHKIAVYAGPNAGATGKSSSYANAEVLIDSFNGHYDLVMKRYFEDVGYYLSDIVTHCDTKYAFEFAKKVESALGESVQSKLKEITPSEEEWSLFINGGENTTLHPRQRIRCKFFRDNQETIYFHSYSRLGILFAINELYRHLGLSSQSEKYSTAVRQLRNRYTERFGTDFIENAERTLVPLDEMRKALRYYFANDEDRLFDMRSDSPLWVKQFIHFIQFLFDLRSQELPPEQGRIFISYQHSVPQAEEMRRQMESLVKRVQGDRVKVLYVGADNTGPRFREFIKVRLWQSDRLFCIAPRDPETMSKSKVKDYKWIAREAEHTTNVLRKRTTYLLEEKLDVNQLKSDIADPELDYLAPNARVEEGRGDRLVEDFEKNVQIHFAFQDGSVQVDPRVERELLRACDRAVETRHFDMVVGYLLQFTQEQRFMIACLHEIVPAPTSMSKKTIVSELMEQYPDKFLHESATTKTFEKLWANARPGSRTMHIKGKELTLMNSPKNGQYTCSLSKLLESIPQDLQDSQNLVANARLILEASLGDGESPWNKSDF